MFVIIFWKYTLCSSSSSSSSLYIYVCVKKPVVCSSVHVVIIDFEGSETDLQIVIKLPDDKSYSAR